MTVYVAMRDRHVISVHTTASEAQDAAQGPNAYVDVRRGIHPNWNRPEWWRKIGI